MSQDLKQQFLAHKGRDIFKWEHFFDIYQRHCAEFVGGSPVVLEFGVMRGGSLQLWRDYFGHRTAVHGVDINPRCKSFEEEGIQIHTGDQSDMEFLRALGERIGPFDIIIDDGSHRMDHQRITLEAMWPHLKEGGVYICEDTHTSYFTRFDGGYGRKGTFIERAKGLVDCLHMWWSGRMAEAETAMWTPHLAGIHFYPACVVLEKRGQDAPNAIWNEQGAIRREPPKTLEFGREVDPSG